MYTRIYEQRNFQQGNNSDNNDINRIKICSMNDLKSNQQRVSLAIITLLTIYRPNVETDATC